MFINHSSKQVTAKIVYYGPGLSGKTTNLHYIFSVTNPRTRGELVSIETDVERTLFFDLLPINVGLVNGYQTKFQLYTVPGQVFYDSTRQLVLKGADGVVFVADSQELMENANKESLENLKINLTKHNQDIREIPVIFQYNKQDLQNIFNVELLNKKINYLHAPYYGAVATKGTGVIETLREISSLTLKKIKGLLDQSLQVENKRAFVKFDTDEKHAVIKRDELPLKKVSVKTVEDFHNKISFTDEEEKALPLSHEKTRVEEREDVMDLGGFEQMEEMKKKAANIDSPDEIPELKGFDIMEEGEDIAEIPEVPEIPEIPITPEVPKVLDIIEPELPEIPGMPKVPRIHVVPDPPKNDEIPELMGFEEDELQIEIEDDTKEFDDVMSSMKKEELQKSKTVLEVPGVVEPPETKKVPSAQAVPPAPQVQTIPAKQTTPPVPPVQATAPVQPKPSIPQVPPAKPKPQVQTIPPASTAQKAPEVKKPEEIKPVDGIRNEPQVTAPIPPHPQTTPQPEPPVVPILDKKKPKSAAFDFFDKLKDDSRITIIKKINKLPKNNGPVVIEIKDEDSHLLEPIEVTVTPGTKKITLIIDVK